MSLLLKKDYKEKASYYVWFLGAQESNDLRSDYIIRNLIPQFLKRSRDHEPLKVTLQISQKGLKIIQGSIKHHIPHDAITSSIVSNDIVACTLLLSNPTAKSPLHVHAYRCDSKMTAYTLHDHLQSLISKPENQRKLAELEIKLSRPIITRESPPHRRFESSLGGSDTGTSTRESECSEEQQGPSVSPTVDKQVFNSLAQELKFKLKAKEGPLLLPPKDYDTICRSKGNLVAVDMRRCQNSDIVGSNKKSLQRNKQKSSNNNNNQNVPIHRSGGKFEWDQRRDLDSSSDDDWKNNGERIFAKNFESKLKMSPSPPLESYKIPLKSSSSCKSGRDYCSCRDCYSKANNVDLKYERRDDDNPAARRRGHQYDNEGEFRKNTSPPLDDFESGLMRQHSERYRTSVDRNVASHRQQYCVDERFERNQQRPPRSKIEPEHKNVKKISMKNFENTRKFSDRNPYREPENLFYHESVENMMKSPLLNNFTNRKQYRDDRGDNNDEQYHLRESGRRKLPQQQTRQGDYEPENSRKSTHSAPESTLRKASAKERFMSAKEKFEAMAERNRYDDIHPHHHHTPVKDHRLLEKCPSDVCSECSLDENSSPCEDSDCSKRNNLNFYRQSFLTKSLGNLTKGGFRHSVALPEMSYKYCNRVGLAAIDY